MPSTTSALVKALFSQQQEHLQHFFAHLDPVQCAESVDVALRCSGVLFFTGVGKSGYIAQKIAATLMSTGTKAFFLSPLDALHGDIGMVGGTDCVFLMSKSGETEELLQTLPFLRNKGATLISVTSTPKCRLGQGCDYRVVLPCSDELCPFGLAPTTSTEIQLLYGDMLTAALMRLKQVELLAYAENHPAGRIGKRATIRVGDCMLEAERAPLCPPERLLRDALADLTQKRCGCLVVVDAEKKLRGIFTDGDLRRALHTYGGDVLLEKVENLMTPQPKAIPVGALAWDALQLMESDPLRPITVLPVLEDEQVVGVVKMHDLVQAGL